MELLKILSGIEYKTNGNTNLDIKSISYDSRNVEANSLFVCIKGFEVDGHRFAASAIKKGAIALLVENEIDLPDVTVIKVKNTRKALAIISNNFYNNPSSKMNIIGVTGTNGKTSITYLISAIFNYKGEKTGIIGTIQNSIGDRIIKTSRTTPESLELQKLFYDMDKEKVDTAIIEVSSHSLSLNRVESTDFDIGIFTNLTQDHLDFHKTMDNYLKAKSLLFSMCKIGIINIDDDASSYIINNSNCKIFTYSIVKDSDFKATNISIDSSGSSFEVIINEKIEEFYVSIPGKFSVYNTLAAIIACISLGVAVYTIKRALNEIKGVKGRCEVVENNKGYNIIVDYAHTPDGLLNILNTVKEFSKGRIITVFGCGGDRDRKKRPIMGEIAGNNSDISIITSDNPRSEDPVDIIDEIEVGIINTNCIYKKIVDRKDAIRYAISIYKKDDIMVIAGKGHENYQILKDKTIHFDDVEVVLELLQGE